MANDVDYKEFVKDGAVKAAGEAGSSVLNTVDILKEHGGARDGASSTGGDLKGAAAASGAADTIMGKDKIDRLECWSKILILDKKLEPLNKTETMILKNMLEALNSASVDKVQDVLAALVENPGSVERVLLALKDRVEKYNSQNTFNWETGKDNQGNEFVRLNLQHKGRYSNFPGSLGSVDLTIGSDGRNYARHGNEQMDVGKALNEFLMLEIKIDPKPRRHVLF